MKKFDDDFIQYNEKKVKDETQTLAFYFLKTIPLYILLIFFAIFFTWYTVFITTHSFYKVSGPSMMPSLNNQITNEQLTTLSQEKLRNLTYDAVYIEKTSNIKLFDIVVIDEPGGAIIKRIVAQSGDYVTIAMHEDELGNECFYFYRIPKGENLATFTDEMALVDETSGDYNIRSYEEWTSKKSQTEEKTALNSEVSHIYEEDFYEQFLIDYFDENEAEFNYFVSSSGLVYVQVPENRFFYMGDNRAWSQDARKNGFGVTKKIVGRAEIVVKNYNFVNRLWEVIKFYFKEMEKFFAR